MLLGKYCKSEYGTQVLTAVSVYPISSSQSGKITDGTCYSILFLCHMKLQAGGKVILSQDNTYTHITHATICAYKAKSKFVFDKTENGPLDEVLLYNVQPFQYLYDSSQKRRQREE